MHKKLARLVTWLAEMLDRNLIMVPRSRRTLSHPVDLLAVLVTTALFGRRAH